ncbi:MAG: toprim domain-containing protein [Proteobacteria bacterium]|nr:toprim domain-containing protein [Pseudomonadota bacterium]
MSKQYDIGEIAALLASRAEAVCQWLLPQGKREGREWRAGSIGGDAGQSLGVNLSGKAGVWRDFADNAKGGDLIDLIQAVRGCNKAEAVKEAKEFLGISDDMPAFLPQRKAYSRPEKPRGITNPGEEMLHWFAARGISAGVVKAFKVGQIETKQHGPVIVFPYLRGTELVFIKYRPLHDKKGMWTSKDSEPCLFGWQVANPDSRDLVVVEGELDAMAFFQGGFCAVSVPRGGGDGDKQDGWIDSEWDRLQLYDRIFLALDNDEQGQKAAEHIARRLGAHRCFNVNLGQYKDANEALLDGADMGALFDSAHTIDPSELRPATSYVDEVFAYYADADVRHGETLPWRKTENTVRIRNGETTIWAGINGHGKSQVAGHVATHSMAMGGRWCVASMEFKPYKMLARMFRQATATSQPTLADRGPLIDLCSDRLWVFDVQGNARADRILEVFEYAYRRYGVTHFLIDSLAKCGFGEDAYNEQKAFVDRLSDFARNNDVQVHLVCHSRKRQDESDVPDKFDIKGTGAITDMVDNVFIVWRNKPKEKKIQEAVGDWAKQQARADGPDAILSCCKQREGEWEGYIKLWFDPRTLQYLESIDEQPVRYCN